MNKATRILVVDDEPAVLEVFSMILRRAGYEVWEASNGQQCLQVTRERRPDLVLLDVRLPDLSGIDICRQIKADAALLDIFVVLVSGKATNAADKVDGAETGADDYIVKPVNPDEFLARIRTIVRLRDTTAALRASEQHYRRLVEILPDAVGMIDLQGRLTTANRQAVEMLGYAGPGELLGKSAFDLTPPEEHERMKADLTVTLETGVMRNAEYTMLRKNGGRFPVELSAAVSTDADGQSRGIVIVARDITARQQAEEELRLLPLRIIEAQEAERLRVARELHDGVNQLIASAKMRLRKVEAGVVSLNPAAREILARCSRLLVQALEENRRIAHNLRPSDLDEFGLAAASRNFCKELQSRTKLEVKYNIARIDQRLAPALELNLFRILQEAVNNIEKHARAREVRLRIAFHGDSIVLKIQDDGRGFDSKRGKAGKGKWRGIGLTNMRERAEFLGGTCAVESAPKRGTTITVRVPYGSAK